MTALLVLLIVGMTLLLQNGTLEREFSSATLVIFGADTALTAGLAAMFCLFGIRLLRNKRRMPRR